jgi:hydroxyethylthiazole kinase-like uncharacterized protein yjeF
MRTELLTPEEMREADRRTIASGQLDGYGLMLRAGDAVAHAVLACFPAAEHIDVLCGPGNNGGDGYVAARLLASHGVPVGVWVGAAPREQSDAARAAAECQVKARPLAQYRARPRSVVIDALFGAGLDRPLDEAAASVARQVAAIAAPVIAVDMPSGVSGLSGVVLGAAFKANMTVTFVRKKPGHLLEPGRSFCGEVLVADIGLPDSVVAELAVRATENGPQAWRQYLPILSKETHKYARGHVAVRSGGLSSTGAARLSALASARIGAGAVTMLSPDAALAVNAAHLTSIMLRRADNDDDVVRFLEERSPAAFIYGPGLGVGEQVGDVVDLLGRLSGSDMTIVLDADAITALSAACERFFPIMRDAASLRGVLTPHHGEFGRLFPDLAIDASLSKLERARLAASRSACVVIYKGPDTVIAAPDGRAAINSNGTPLLATAGSGDVLAGLVAGLCAQRMPTFEAACAAVWIHAQAAHEFGPGLVAEDLLGMVPAVLRRLALR